MLAATMEINYLGHSAFKIKGKAGVVVTDPYNSYIGFQMSSVSADVVTISHDHKDHNYVQAVRPSSRRKTVFTIDKPGAYELGGISVFGIPSFHDDEKGSLRGENTIFVTLLDDIRVCHLGDLGHELGQEQVSQIGSIDVLLCPVGGHFTIDPKEAMKTIRKLDPSIVIPMHYKTPDHDEKVFADLEPLDTFLQVYGVSPQSISSLKLEKTRLPEETELVLLQND